MDLNNLATFISIVEHGSFTKAAQALRWPKSRVSRKLGALEAELGVLLLHRTTRQLQLTEAGQNLFANCQPHLTQVERALANASLSSEDLAGHLKVTAPVDIGKTLLLPVIREHQRLHPRVVIDLNLTNELVDVVATGTDVALRLGRLKDSSLRVRNLGRATVSMLASPNYLARKGEPVSLDDMQAHACLSFRTGKEEAVWRLRNGKSRRSIKLRPQFFCNDIDVLVAMVLDSMGICLLPDLYCRRQLQGGQLVRVLPKWQAAPVPLQMLHSDRKTPARVKSFMALVYQRLRSQLG